jgi:hypothetical protein
MGEYLYIDEQGHNLTVTHRMLYSSSVVCDACGAEMWRKPQPVSVTWGGLAPSGGELAPDVQELIDTAPERRAVFEAEHEAHERRTGQGSVNNGI